MRKSEQCPKCDSEFVGVIKGATWVPRVEGKSSMSGYSLWKSEAWICRDCGLTEYYVDDPPPSVRWLREPPKSDQPYR